MKRFATVLALALVTAVTACGDPKGTPVEKILEDIDLYYGKTITIRTQFRSGARCRLDSEDGEWKTYCKDCQFCRGPIVVAPEGAVETKVDDWPMILGGVWEFKDIRCTGPLNKVECYPFELGKTYVVRGTVEQSKPPKLFVSRFWPVK